jgi:hypothetical protein
MSGDMPLSQNEDAHEKSKGWPLPVLVVLGLLASLVVLGGLAWYFSQQQHLQECADECASWKVFPPLEQDGMFAVVRNSVTAAAALGIGVTIVLSYRRQKVAEDTLKYTAQTQRLAVEAQNLATQRLDRESLDILRKRYLDIAELLNSPGSLNRITALHALESLAISWRQFKNDREASATVGLLLSTARLANEDKTDQGEEFRETVGRTLNRHFRIEVSNVDGWGSLAVDATGCIGRRGIRDWIIDSGNLTASPRNSKFITVDGLQIMSGTVHLRNTGPQTADSRVEGNRLRRLIINDGELTVSVRNRGHTDAVTIVDSTLIGGRISILSLDLEASPSVYNFKDCTFRGTTLRTSPQLPAEFVFERCTFHAAPSTWSWLATDTRTATFKDCFALLADKNLVPIANLTELYAHFEVAASMPEPQ